MGKARELIGNIEMKKYEWASNFRKDYSNTLVIKEIQCKRTARCHFN